MIKKLLLTVFLVLVQTVVFGATNTYTGATTVGGKLLWSTGANWSLGTVPTATDDVVIPSGKTVITDVTSISVNSITVSGTMDLEKFATTTINSQLIVVTSPNGHINFDHSILILPSNVALYLQNGSNSLNGSCNNNDEIFVGTVQYAVCVGGGALYLFAEIETAGGINVVTAGVIGSTQSICSGSTPATLTSTTVATGSGIITYEWQTNASGSYVTIPGATGATFTPPALISTTSYKRRTVSVNGGYTFYSAYTTPLVITVNARPTVPTASVSAQPTCKTPTGTITVTAPSPATGITYTVTGTDPVVAAVTNPTGVFAGLAPGKYNVKTTNASGCTSSPTALVEINAFVEIENRWTGTAWVVSDPPTAEQKIVFDGVFSSEGDIEACSCIVNNLVGNLGDVIINSGHTLKLTNGLTVATTTLPSGEIIAGSMAFLDGASLVQINDVQNEGDIDYQRITGARKTDYTYWSSPVTPITLGELYYPTGGTFYSYEATAAGEDWSPFDAGTDMVAGKGYIANQGAEVPSGIPTPPGLLEVTFVGVPNNGHYEIDAIADRSYLLGNPYPSALDADTFLTDNEDILDGTLYFWTHNTEIQDATNIGTNPDGSPKAGSGAYAYTSDDYASYNFTGGVGTGTGNFENGNEEMTNKPTGKIASGQGFFATGIAAGTIIFNNDMRVGVNGITGDNSQFFKTKNPNKSSKKIQKNRIWLNLTNAQGAFKQTLIGYVTDATNDFDSRFDGESFDGNEFVDFYSVNQDKNLVIQGRALPFDENDEVPLGFRTTINGAFTIKIDQVDGLLTNQAIFIEDKLTNTVFDLKSGNYTFNTVAGTFNDRFILRYNENNSSKTLESANFDSLEKTVLVSNKNKQIKIDSSLEMIDKVAIYDLLGKQIYQKTNVNSNELSISNLVSSRQMLMVKTVLQNGETVTKKIIY